MTLGKTCSMIFGKRITILASLLIVMSCGIQLSKADSGCANPVQFCQDCEIVQTMRASPGGYCSTTVYTSGMFEGASIVRRPNSGFAGTSGASYGYKADKNFSGKDEFTVEIRWVMRTNVKTKTRIKVTVLPY